MRAMGEAMAARWESEENRFAIQPLHSSDCEGYDEHEAGIR